MIETNFKNKTEKIITHEEFVRILTAIEANNDSPFKSAVVLFYELGLRSKELLNLRWCDISFEKDTIAVSFFESDKKRILTLPARSKSSLMSIKEYRNACSGDPVFISHQGRQMTISQFLQKLKFYMKQASIMPDKIALTPHLFRRTHAIRLYEKFAFNLVNQMMSHSKTQATNHLAVNSAKKRGIAEENLAKRQRTPQKKLKRRPQRSLSEKVSNSES